MIFYIGVLIATCWMLYFMLGFGEVSTVCNVHDSLDNNWN